MNDFYRQYQSNPQKALIPSSTVADLIKRVDEEIPSAQMQSAIAKFNKGIFTFRDRVNNDFTVANASVNLSINNDASFWWLVYAISVLKTTAVTDLATQITSIRINSLSDFLNSPWAVSDIQQFNGKPVDFYCAVPPNATLNVALQNGATGTNSVYIQFHGIHVPREIGDQLLRDALREGTV